MPSFSFSSLHKAKLADFRGIKKRGVPVILVTSPPVDEVQDLAAVLLPCFVDAGGIKNTAVTPICLADCLFNAIATENGFENNLKHERGVISMARTNETPILQVPSFSSWQIFNRI